jgi:hypothetical protein
MSSAQQQQALPPIVERSAESAADSGLSLEQMSRIMDVAVELRKERTLAERELDRDESRRILHQKLREAAAVSGGTLSDAEIEAAINHYYDRLHAFEEPASSWQTFLAHVYIRRTQVAVALTAIGAAILAWSVFSLGIWIHPASTGFQNHWPKANLTVAWGNAPGSLRNTTTFDRRSYSRAASMNMAFGQMNQSTVPVPRALPQATVKEGRWSTRILITASAAIDIVGRSDSRW